jgi:hypothetical protein
MKLPLSDLDPHPFVARDVQQEDWLRYVANRSNILIYLNLGVLQVCGRCRHCWSIKTYGGYTACVVVLLGRMDRMYIICRSFFYVRHSNSFLLQLLSDITSEGNLRRTKLSSFVQ